MKLPTPRPQYDLTDQANVRRLLEQADQQNLKRGQDIEGSRVILRSPSGTRYQITVSDAGTLSATAL